MEISFSAVENVQVVELAGRLGEAEAAAVRFKLEEKINQGRTKVLFDLTRYDLLDESARGHVIGIILYSITRDALTACCGIETLIGLCFPCLTANKSRSSSAKAKD